MKHSPTPHSRSVGVYLGAAERIFLSQDTEDGYNMPCKEFHKWWLFHFAGSGPLSDVRVEHAVLSLCFMAAIVEEK